MGSEQTRLRRVLGRFDLTIFLIAALVNLNSIPVVAGAGSIAILFWILGFFLFFLPQGIAVIELSSRFPEEGGIYRWSKIAFGDFHGFISGWCYWTNNIFYIPTLLFYMVGFAAFIGGGSTTRFAQDPFLMALTSLVLLWVVTWLNIMGWGVGRWVQSVGVFGTVVTAAILLGVGIVGYRLNPSVSVLPSLGALSAFSDWRMFALISVVCLNFIGLELGPVIGDEIREPRRSIPRAAVMAGLVTVVLYVVSTASLQMTMPAEEIGVIDGILQGVKRTVTELQLPWLVVPIALLMTFNAAGNTSAWLAGSARIPFVVGLDRYLPAVLGRLHPRYETPWVALTVQGVASSVFILVNAIGSSVHDMYLILLQSTIILQLIPYLYMFGALVLMAREKAGYRDEESYFRRPRFLQIVGALGLIVTAAGTAFAFLPTAGIADVWNFEWKLLLGTLGLLIPAVVIFRIHARRQVVAQQEPVEPLTEA